MAFGPFKAWWMLSGYSRSDLAHYNIHEQEKHVISVNLIQRTPGAGQCSGFLNNAISQSQRKPFAFKDQDSRSGFHAGVDTLTKENRESSESITMKRIYNTMMVRAVILQDDC
jgi:hypothetical protein